MDQTPPEYQDIEFPLPKIQRRRKLLPWWVLAFMWIFMVFAAIVPVGFILGLLGYDFNVSLLGLSTNNPLSLIGAVVMLLFLFKGITGLALWTERVWAVRVAKIDAIISTVICVGVMVYALLGHSSFSIRLELVAIIPYYFKMTRIQYDWENFGTEGPVVPEVTGAYSPIPE
jgi:hypothetical protein